MIKISSLLCLCFLYCFTNAQQTSTDLASTANIFISLLNKEQKSKTVYALDDNERFNWHFVPRSRNGIALKDLTIEQKKAALSLLKISLSQQGYSKASGIIGLEDILREVEGRPKGDSYRDQTNYYFTIFGSPSNDKVWGWRIEGHHVSLNFSSANGLMESATPSFFGSNPAIVPSGSDKGKQILKDETNFGYSLIHSLSEDQLKVAWIDKTAPGDILSFNNRKAVKLDPKGIQFTRLTEKQKEIFQSLVDTYIKNYTLGFSSKLQKKIEDAGINNLYFAWAGSLKTGEGHYYRIQGPMLLIEYDNTQNNANHVHSVVRDLTNDFAEDILREHYRKENQH